MYKRKQLYLPITMELCKAVCTVILLTRMKAYSPAVAANNGGYVPRCDNGRCRNPPRPYYPFTPRPAPKHKADASCPCLRVANAGCVQYDPQMAASTIEDAVYNFRDLTQTFGPAGSPGGPAATSFGPVRGPQGGTTVAGRPAPESVAKCTTAGCPSCAMAMARQMLRSNAISQSKYGELRSAAGGADPDECTYYKFKDKSQGRGGGSGGRTSVSGLLKSTAGTAERVDGTSDQISKHELDCYAARTPDGLGGIRPCQICWSVLILPANYMPRYLNQVSCDGGSGVAACLQGQGQCFTHHTTMLVYANVGTDDNPSHVQRQVSAGRWCHCSIKHDSQVAALI